MGKDDNQYQTVAAGKKAARPKVACTKAGCSGTCPLHVVLRSNRQDGVPAKCFVCDRKFKVPPGAGLQPKQPKNKQLLGDPSIKKELEAVKKELQALKAAQVAPTATEVTATAGDCADTGLQAELKAARTEISFLRSMDATHHGLIRDGFGAALAAAEAKRDSILARQRGGLPVKAQLAKAQAHVESTAKRLEAEQKKSQQLAAEQTALAERLAQQTAATAAAATKLSAAKAELAAISAKVSAENGAPKECDNGLQGGSVTKQAVADLCTFAANPGVQQALVAAGMPEDQQARVVSALQAVSVGFPSLAATCPQPPGSGQEDAANGSAIDEELMELDDEFLTQMAEAAVPPAEPGGDNGAEERRARVAETKARLSSKKGDLEQGQGQENWGQEVLIVWWALPCLQRAGPGNHAGHSSGLPCWRWCAVWVRPLILVRLGPPVLLSTIPRAARWSLTSSGMSSGCSHQTWSSLSHGSLTFAPPHHWTALGRALRWCPMRMCRSAMSS